MSAKDSGKETWNVLLVSHGGWIRELIGHLLQDYSCSGIPLKRWQECCPNTGVSRFNIGVYKEGDLKVSSVDCTLFQCKGHLDSAKTERTCKCNQCDISKQ